MDPLYIKRSGCLRPMSTRVLPVLTLDRWRGFRLRRIAVRPLPARTWRSQHDRQIVGHAEQATFGQNEPSDTIFALGTGARASSFSRLKNREKAWPRLETRPALDRQTSSRIADQDEASASRTTRCRFRIARDLACFAGERLPFVNVSMVVTGVSAAKFCRTCAARVQRSPNQRVRIANQASHAIVRRCLPDLTRTRRCDEGIIGIGR